MDKIGNLPAAIFSPAKMVYISFVILTGSKILPVPRTWVFLLVSVVFLIAEIVHNDYLRIRLNIAAESHRVEGSEATLTSAAEAGI